MKKGPILPSQGRLAPDCCWWIVLILVAGSMAFLGSFLGSLYSHELSLSALHSQSASDTSVPVVIKSNAFSHKARPAHPDPEGADSTDSTSASSPSTSEDQDRPEVAAAQTSPPAAASFDLDARTRSHWQQLVAVCNNRNYTSCRSIDRSSWTDASRTTFSSVNFAGLGAWSTFKLHTHDNQGRVKSKGGDTWFMTLRDEAQRIRMPTRIFDEGDGSYTVAVYFLLPGTYKIWSWLWYSDCHGYQEPAQEVDYIFSNHEDFFNAMKKEDHCYIGQRLRFPTFVFDVPQSAAAPACMKPGCSAALAARAPDIKARKGGHTWRTEEYHYLMNGSYVSLPCCKPRLPVRKHKDPAPERLLFCGDSTVFHSWTILVQGTRRPCKFTWSKMNVPGQLNDEALKPEVCPAVSTIAEMDPELDPIVRRCTGGAPWTTVPVGADTEGSARNSPFPLYFDMKNFQYNDVYARTHVPPVQLPLPRNFSVVFLESGTMRTMIGVRESVSPTRQKDVLVINMGAHYCRVMRFDAWRSFMDELAAELKAIQVRTDALVVWRTSFLLKENALRSNTNYGDNGYVNTAKFNTDARRLLFESYAEHALARVGGVHVWDVYGLSAVGENRPGDMFHAAGPSTWAQNTDMLDLFACKA